VFIRGDLNWCLQTYLILARRGRLAVQCSNKLKDDCINLIHSDHLLRLRGDAHSFLVCIRADYPRRLWAQYHLVQNQQQCKAGAGYLPHWVQPGLIKRHPARQQVKRVAYAGAPIKGNLAGSWTEWKRLFEPHGLEFVLLPSGSWHDLSSVDVLLGIRTFGRAPHHSKPPTKLLNAWHANIPFVGGHDSAFKQIGTPGEDYLLASSPKPALAAVLQLRDDPALYTTLVSMGQQRANEYAEACLAERWEEMLLTTIAGRYRKWKQQPAYERIRFRVLQEAGLIEHNTKQLIKGVLHKAIVFPTLRKALS
jgi:hypothetical protein